MIASWPLHSKIKSRFYYACCCMEMFVLFPLTITDGRRDIQNHISSYVTQFDTNFIFLSSVVVELYQCHVALSIRGTYIRDVEGSNLVRGTF